MNRRAVRRLGWSVWGVVVCLSTPACRTRPEAQVNKAADAPVVCAAPEEDTALLECSYDVRATLLNRYDEVAAALRLAAPSSSDTDWKAFFSALGVKWPDGSSIEQAVWNGKLKVRNTRDNLMALETVLRQLAMLDCMVNVDVEIVAFRMEDIERLQCGAGVSKETLFALRRAGRAKPVAAACVETKSGSEVTVKTVQEEPLVLEIGMTSSGNDSSPPTGVLAPSLSDMREIGMILQATPTILADNGELVELMLEPRWVTLNRWEAFQADVVTDRTHKVRAFRQPVFEETSFQTKLTVGDGETVLFASCSTPDSAWLHAGFLTVNLRGGGDGIAAMPNHGNRKAQANELQDRLLTRFYQLTPGIQGCRFDGDSIAQEKTEPAPTQTWESFFERFGVQWPEGSSVTMLRAINRLRVTNTRENLKVFEQALRDCESLPCLIDVEVQIAAFRAEDIENLRVNGGLTKEALESLRREGRAKPVGTASVVASPGSQAVVDVMQEVLYPRELVLDEGSRNDTPSSLNAVIPSNMEMHEVGMTLQVIPEIPSGSELINLLLHPQWHTLERWTTYPADVMAGRAHKEIPFRQPVFGVTEFPVETSVKSGETVVLGSCSAPDPKWVHVGFVTARRLDVPGRLYWEVAP